MQENREKTIIRTSIIGILVNVLLAGFKFLVGILSHSVAVTMDAVNNLSDAMSSVITIGLFHRLSADHRSRRRRQNHPGAIRQKDR